MDYIDLYNKLIISPSISQEVFKIASEIRKEKRYFEVEQYTGVSASLVGAIHQLESGRNFKTHLHNGDLLSRKTRRSPAGRPDGRPPFTWLESAIDAVDYDNLTLSTSKAEQCKSAVRYNGLGYEKHRVVSPYGFTGSQFYKKGKYVSDGRYSPRTISTQIGVCVILKEIERLDKLNVPPMPVKPLSPVTEGTVVISNRIGDDIVPVDSQKEGILNKIAEAPPVYISPIVKPIKFTQPKSSTKISKYLTVGQFTKNGTRKFVSQKHFQACKDLAIALDRVQAFYGKRLIITSGIRTPAQNRSAGGVSGSYHLSNNQTCAADVKVVGVRASKVNNDFDNVWVGGLGAYTTGITHFDLGENRRWRWSGSGEHSHGDEIKNFASGEHKQGDKDENEKYTSIFPVYKSSDNKGFTLKTKHGSFVIKSNVNMYIGDVILATNPYT